MDKEQTHYEEKDIKRIMVLHIEQEELDKDYDTFIKDITGKPFFDTWLAYSEDEKIKFFKFYLYETKYK